MNSLIKIDDIIINLDEIQAVTYWDTGNCIYEYQLFLKNKDRPIKIAYKTYKKLLEIIDRVNKGE